MRSLSVLVVSLALQSIGSAQERVLPLARLGSEQLQHPGRYIAALAFSPDGKLLASGGQGLSVSVWETTTGKEVQRLRTAERTIYIGSRTRSGTDHIAVSAVRFSPDGKLLAAGCNGAVHVWETDTWKERHRLRVDGMVWTVGFSPDGKAVLALDSRDHDLISGTGLGQAEQALCRWDAVTGRELDRFVGKFGTRESTLSPDGQYLPENRYREIALRRTDTGQVGPVIVGPRDSLRGDRGLSSLSFTPDGKLAAFSTDQGYHLWDLEQNREVTPPRKKKRDEIVLPIGLLLSPDGKQLIGFGSGQGPARRSTQAAFVVYDLEEGKEVHRNTDVEPRERQYPTTPLVLSRDGKWLATSKGNRIELWTVNEARKLALPGGDAPSRPTTLFRLSADGKRLVTLSAQEDVARVWEVDTGTMLHRFPGKAKCAALSADGKRVAVGREFPEGDVRVFDVATGKELLTLRDGGENRHIYMAVAFLEKDRKLATLDGQKRVSLWDLETGKKEREEKSPPDSYLPTIKNATSDGRLILTLLQRGDVLGLWDLETGKARPLALSRWRNYSGQPEPVISPDGLLVAGVDYERYALWVFDAEKQKLVTASMPTRGPRSAILALSSGRQLLAIGDREHEEVRLWDVETRRQRGMLRTGHTGMVAMTFTPDGKRLLTSGSDGSIRVWDTAKLEPARPLVAAQSPTALARMYENLLGLEMAGGEAFWGLVEGGSETVKVLREKIPVVPSDAVIPRFPQWSRERMGIEILEYIGTEEARKLLRELAGGKEEAPVTQAARAALKRLNQKQ